MLSEQSQQPTTNQAASSNRPADAAERPLIAWGIAAAIVLIVLGVVLLATHHKPAPPAGTLLPLDPYAPSLVYSDLQMSESSSVTGLKATYIDGHVHNAGSRTVTAASLQVLFANDLQNPPQVESTPLNLIRTHEPYIDTQPLSATPLAPGDTREFRLAFENISPDWNQQLPAIHTVQVTTR